MPVLLRAMAPVPGRYGQAASGARCKAMPARGQRPGGKWRAGVCVKAATSMRVTERAGVTDGRLVRDDLAKRRLGMPAFRCFPRQRKAGHDRATLFLIWRPE